MTLTEHAIPSLQPGPDHLTFMLGWRCNAACVQCWQAAARRSGKLAKNTAPVETVKALIEKYSRTLRSVELCSFGETMLHPHFGEIIAILQNWYARSGSERQRVSLITNGSLLHKHMSIGDMPGQITVSFDAPTAEVYESIRVGLSFSTVWENIQAFAKRENHSHRQIGVNMTIFERNAEMVWPMAKLLSKAGVHYLSTIRGANMGMTAASAEELSADDLRVKQQMHRIRQELPNFTLHDNYSTGSAHQDTTAPAAFRFCPTPWKSLDIGNDGVAHPCCRAYDTELGAPLVDSDPWMHPTLQRLREQLIADALDTKEFKDCAVCPMRYASWSQF